MAIELNCGAVFLHIPKTGGTWVSKALYECGLVRCEIGHKHADLERIIDQHRYGTGREVFRNFVTRKLRQRLWQASAGGGGKAVANGRDRRYFFAFVRHPVSWYESWFRYMSGRDWHGWGDTRHPDKWHPNSPLNGLGSRSFDQFITNVIEKQPGYLSSLYQRYTQDQIDFIGKQESLVDDLIEVLTRLNVKVDEERIRSLAPANKSRETTICWNEHLKAQVSMLEHAAIVRYGYQESRVVPAL